MALLALENLVRPIANNVIAIQTILSNPQLTTPTGREDDDKRLADMRAKLLKTLAAQNASLDIISGFVDTQQMADLQHAGQEYINEVNQPETANALGGDADTESALVQSELRRPSAEPVHDRSRERPRFDARL